LNIYQQAKQNSSTQALKNPGMGKTAVNRGFFLSSRVLEFLSS
jgi:hypothetical protein